MQAIVMALLRLQLTTERIDAAMGQLVQRPRGLKDMRAVPACKQPREGIIASSGADVAGGDKEMTNPAI
jgi:hypothetical protein